MKKIFITFLFCSLFIATKTVAQSNLVWTMKDKMQKGGLKTITTINSEFTGFKSEAEVAKFCSDLKANKDVQSCNVISKTNSTCNLQIVMKSTHDGRYYMQLASNMGVAYVVANQQRKSVSESLAKAQKK
jgi:hypothetical protein